MTEMIELKSGRKVMKFIPFPQPVEDNTIRCICCGQIDEPEYHNDSECPMCVAILTEE